MADTRTTETEHREHSTHHRGEGEAAPRNGVEVFDANTTNTRRDNEAMTGTEFRNNDFTTTDRTSTPITTGTTSQGSNWGTILMVIAIILVIILLGAWLF